MSIKMVVKNRLKIFVIIFLVLAVSAVQAQSNFISGLAIQENAEITVENDLTPLDIGTKSNVNTYVKVSLKYNHLNIPFSSANGLELNVPFVLDCYDINRNIVDSKTGTLTLSYNEVAVEGVDEVAFVEKGNYYKTVLKVGEIPSNQINLITEDIVLESSIIFDRREAFDFSAMTPLPRYFIDFQTHEITINWDYITGATEYELEWLFVSSETDEVLNHDPNNIQLPTHQDFKQNATRIVTNKNEFKFSLSYGPGRLFYRYRPIALHDDNKTKLPGKWSDISLNADHIINDFNPEDPNANFSTYNDIQNYDMSWVYSAAFSNQGRASEQKIFVSPDGKVRQSISKNRADNHLIIAEQKYDFNGAPTISILPGVHKGSSLEYQQSYTLDNSGNPYGKLNFALDKHVEDGSATGADPIKVLADDFYSSSPKYHNNYFSPENPFNGDGTHDYVADANGYGFSQAWYDNQGRLTKAGGVGENLKMGKGHDVKVFYGSANEDELLTLFGNEVGFAEHYTKSMSVDENGIATINYYNLSGQLIATGIAGDKPENLEAIEGTEELVEEDLSHNNVIDMQKQRSLINYDMLVSSEGQHTFNYTITQEWYNNQCNASEDYNCVYDVNFSVTSSMGEAQLLTPTEGTPANQLTYVINANSFEDELGNATDFEIQFTANLALGSYKVWKELVVNEDAFNVALANFQTDLEAGNLCVDSEDQYMSNEFSNFENSFECGDCAQSCAEFSNRLIHYNKTNDAQLTVTDGIAILDELYDLGDVPNFKGDAVEGATWNTYFDACRVEVCVNDMADLDLPAQDCDELKGLFITDFFPGGQLWDNRGINDDANYEPTGAWMAQNVTPTGDNTYFYNKVEDSDFWPPGNGWNWTYRQQSNDWWRRTEMVQVDRNDFTNPDKFFELSQNFRSEWADDIVEYHPEYCEVLICNATSGFVDDTRDIVGSTYENVVGTSTNKKEVIDNWVNKYTKDAAYVKNRNFAVNGDYKGKNISFDLNGEVGPYRDFISWMADDFRLTEVDGFSGSGHSMKVLAEAQAKLSLNLTPGDALDATDDLHMSYYFHNLKQYINSARGLYLAYVKVLLKEKISSFAGCESCSYNIQTKMSTNEEDYLGGAPYYYTTTVAGKTKDFVCLYPDFNLYMYYQGMKAIENKAEPGEVLVSDPGGFLDISGYDFSSEFHEIDQQSQDVLEKYVPANQDNCDITFEIDLNALKSVYPNGGGFKPFLVYEDNYINLYNNGAYVAYGGQANGSSTDLVVGGTVSDPNFCLSASSTISDLTAKIIQGGVLDLVSMENSVATFKFNEKYLSDQHKYPVLYFEPTAISGCTTVDGNNGFAIRAKGNKRKKVARFNIGEIFYDAVFDNFTYAAIDILAKYELKLALSVSSSYEDAGSTYANGFSIIDRGFNTSVNLTEPFEEGVLQHIFENTLRHVYGEDVDVTDPAVYAVNHHFTQNNHRFIINEFFKELEKRTKPGVTLSLDGDFINIEYEYSPGEHYESVFSIMELSPSNTVMAPAFLSCFGQFPAYRNSDVIDVCEPKCESKYRKYVIPADFFEKAYCGGAPNYGGNVGQCNAQVKLGFYNHEYLRARRTGSDDNFISNMGGAVYSNEVEVAYKLFDFTGIESYGEADAFNLVVNELQNYFSGFEVKSNFNTKEITLEINNYQEFSEVDLHKMPFMAVVHEGQMNSSFEITDKEDECCDATYIVRGIDIPITDVRQNGLSLGFGAAHPNYFESYYASKLFQLGPKIEAAEFQSLPATEATGREYEEFVAQKINAIQDSRASAFVDVNGKLNILFTLSELERVKFGRDFYLTESALYESSQLNTPYFDYKRVKVYDYNNCILPPPPQNCFCEELSEIKEDVVSTTGLTDELEIANEVAIYYNRKYGPNFMHPVNYTSGYTIDQNMVLNWMNNCDAYDFPESEIYDGNGDVTDYTNTVPNQLKCWGCDNRWEQEEIYIQTALTKRANDIAQEIDDFQDGYYQQCLQGENLKETLTVSYTKKDYDYTLFYYNEIGELVRTVSPEGVRKLSEDELQQAKDYLHTSASDGITIEEQHIAQQIHEFEYNTLGQVRKSSSPDMGESEVIYDRFGRVVLSQNEEQADAADGTVNYNFTQYDHLSRPTRMGELTVNPNLASNTELSASLKKTNSANVNMDQWFDLCDHSEVSVFKYGYNFWNESIAFDVVSELNQEERNHITQLNTRLRPVAMLYYPLHENYSGDNYQSANYYVYNNVGQVVTHLQENAALQGTEQRFIKTSYEFDPYTSEMQKIKYQEGKEDQFFTKLEYDELGRLKASYSSLDDILYKLESKTHFYNHGALSRVELGHHAIQGLDFVYRLNGQLKAMNSSTLSAERDMGHDGLISSTQGSGVNDYFARDVAGFSLGYFTNDYRAIGDISASNQAFSAINAQTNTEVKDLYNGMITSSVTAIYSEKDVNNNGTTELVKDPQLGIYKYDMKYRLTEAAYMVSNDVLSTNSWDNAYFDANGTGTTKDLSSYYTHFEYDRNTNITALVRNGKHNGTTAQMDNLTYHHHYRDVNGDGNQDLMGNKLYHVTDLAGNAGSGDYADNSNPSYLGTDGNNFNNDVAQINSSNNFEYNKIGALVKNEEEGYTIQWNSRRKVKSITRFNNTKPGPNIEFVYNALGKQIAKIVKPRNLNPTSNIYELAPSSEWKHEYYGFDATGNVMATYEHKIDLDQNNRKNNFTRAVVEFNDVNGGLVGGLAPMVTVEITTPDNNSESFETDYFSSGTGEEAAAIIAHEINQNSAKFYASIKPNCNNCLEIVSRYAGGDLNGSAIQVTNTNYSNEPLTVLKQFSGGGLHPTSGEVTESKLKDHSILAGGRIGIRKTDKILTGELPESEYHQTHVGKRYYEIKNWLGSVISVVKDIKFKKNGSTVQEEDFNNGTYNSSNWNMDGATISITGTSPEMELLVDAPVSGNAVEYTVSTQPGKEYTVQFKLGLVTPGEVIKIESRNDDPSNPTTHNNLITRNSVYENGTYSIHFTAQSSSVSIRFLTEGTNGANFTIDDVKVTKGGHYEAVIAQSSDYYPYGMRMKGRGITGKYAYGYQGSRSVDELEGEGNTYTTEFRQLDSRLGIWRSPDPVFQPWQSPYNSMDGNPINYTDVRGLSVNNGDGTAKAESGDSGWSIWKKHAENNMSWDEFKKQNSEYLNEDGTYKKTLKVGDDLRIIPKAPDDQKEEGSNCEDDSKKEESKKQSSGPKNNDEENGSENTKVGTEELETPSKSNFLEENFFEILSATIDQATNNTLSQKLDSYIVTGQERHFIGPDAVGIGIITEGGVAMSGGEQSQGVILILRGPNKGQVFSYKDGTRLENNVFYTPQIFAGGTIVKFFFTGEIENITKDIFKGGRTNAGFGADVGVAINVGGGRSDDVDDKGNFVLSKSVSVGYGLSPFMFDFGINGGETTIGDNIGSFPKVSPQPTKKLRE